MQSERFLLGEAMIGVSRHAQGTSRCDGRGCGPGDSEEGTVPALVVPSKMGGSGKPRTVNPSNPGPGPDQGIELLLATAHGGALGDLVHMPELGATSWHCHPTVTWRFMGSYKWAGDISRVTIIITHIRGLITPLITTHEPSSTLPRAPRLGLAKGVQPLQQKRHHLR